VCVYKIRAYTGVSIFLCVLEHGRYHGMCWRFQNFCEKQLRSGTVQDTNSNQQAAPTIMHISIYCKSHTDELTTVLLHTGEETKVKRLFYIIVYSLMVGQLRPKHVGVEVLKYKCDSNELCSSVGSHCNNTRHIMCMYNILVARKCSLHCVQRESGAHRTSYLVGSGASSSDTK
jgi:hypothetical protein